MIGHDGLRSNPAASLEHLAADDVRRLTQWNDTAHPYPEHATVGDLFDIQANKTPDRTALIFENEAITFAELQQRSNRLAHLLIEYGVSAESPVGVAMHRSPEAVMAMLAIIKAGGAYVPLDPDYPADRLALMIEDADVDLILTGTDVSGLPESDAELVDVHGFDGSAYPSDSPSGRSTPDDTLYITFTSGSTGRPKGVQGTHRGAINRFTWQWETYPFSENELCCQKTSLNFLDHLWETWGPLLKGHALLIIPDEVVKDGRRFVDILARYEIERLVTVPSLLGTMLRAFPDMGSKLSHLRFVTLSGERLTKELASEFAAVLPDAVLLNLYGMSEASADTTWYDQRWGAQSDSFPIGRPLQNVRVYLLDEERRPVPVGATGEIHVGGVGVAKGYCGCPDLTEERFLPDPFVAEPGARMYRSGDLGRWRPDGLLEFMGRVDHQAKIHGVRIELGEIETAARSLDEIDDAVVMALRMGQDQQLVAYVTLSGGASTNSMKVRDALSSRLPGYMVPARVIVLDRFPLTPHGKVDRGAFPDPIGERPQSDIPYARPRTDIERRLAGVWQKLLLIDQVGVDDSFFDLGGDSLLVIQLRAQLESAFGVELDATDLFEYRTIRRLASRIEAMRAPEPTLGRAEQRVRGGGDDAHTNSSDVAIIGMAGRFPGSPDLDAFWDNLANGVEGLRRLTEEELRTFEPDYQAKLRDPDFVPVAGTLDGIEMFDAEFFGIQPGEARTLDPQHRLWFETAWEALENAGYAPGKTDLRIGVFAGSYMNTYSMHNLLHDREAIDEYVRLQGPGTFMQMLNSEGDYLPTRTSHLLDLRGPAIDVQTACSTSLVAVVLACRAIANRDCEMALAGGASLLVPEAQGYFYQEGGIRSRDGHCRPFDSAGTGTIFTSGVGSVVLKGLDQAVADGDDIRAVIKGAAINNDGAHKASYMAPSIDGQVEVITDALRRADVDPSTIGFVETHGTATPLGDPIEVAALKRAYSQEATIARSVALGSVKSNIGHTDAAAGVAGLIKAVLALKHESIPPTLHFENPNPDIDLDDSPFYVPTRLEPWPARRGPRRAAVSSLGVGGTNAHVVLEEAPPVAESPSARPRRLLLLSARTQTALATMRGALAGHLERHRPSLADVAHTLTVGRADFAHRWSAVAADLEEAIAGLRDEPTTSRRPAIDARDVVMMFPGQGSQFVGMGRELYQNEQVFRDAIDRCSDTLRPQLELDLRDVLYPDDGTDPEAARRLTETGLAQPAIFAVSYAMARLWMSWGVRPTTLVGHSVGEYVAATIAGIVSLEDGLGIIAARARLMQSLPGGSMRAVRLSAEDLAPYLGDGVGLAAVNTPRSSVVSGPDDAVRRFCARMEEADLETIELHTSHAFHSEMMDPILDDFRAVVAAVDLRPPTVPIVSTLTGGLLSDAEATDPGYWVSQVRRPVRFSDAILTLHQEPGRVYLEVGPGKTLSGAVIQHPDQQDGGARLAVIDSLGHPGERLPALGAALAGLGKLWQVGVPVDWDAVYQGESRRRVALPTYPFERQRHWVEPPALSGRSPAAPTAPPATVEAPVSPTAPAPGPSQVPQSGGAGRVERIADRLVAISAERSGLDASAIDRSATFTDLGFDSLFLTGLNAQARREFGVRVSLRQLLSETPTIATLAAHIEPRLDADAFAALPEEPVSPETTVAPPQVVLLDAVRAPKSNGNGTTLATSHLEALIEEQLRIMDQQLDLMRAQLAETAVPLQLGAEPTPEQTTRSDPASAP